MPQAEDGGFPSSPTMVTSCTAGYFRLIRFWTSTLTLVHRFTSVTARDEETNWKMMKNDEGLVVTCCWASLIALIAICATSQVHSSPAEWPPCSSVVGPSSWVPPCHSHRPARKSRWIRCWRSERVGCHSAPGWIHLTGKPLPKQKYIQIINWTSSFLS